MVQPVPDGPELSIDPDSRTITPMDHRSARMLGLAGEAANGDEAAAALTLRERIERMASEEFGEAPWQWGNIPGSDDTG